MPVMENPNEEPRTAAGNKANRAASQGEDRSPEDDKARIVGKLLLEYRDAKQKAALCREKLRECGQKCRAAGLALISLGEQLLYDGIGHPYRPWKFEPFVVPDRYEMIRLGDECHRELCRAAEIAARLAEFGVVLDRSR